MAVGKCDTPFRAAWPLPQAAGSVSQGTEDTHLHWKLSTGMRGRRWWAGGQINSGREGYILSLFLVSILIQVHSDMCLLNNWQRSRETQQAVPALIWSKGTNVLLSMKVSGTWNSFMGGSVCPIAVAASLCWELCRIGLLLTFSLRQF